jgi:hypothetical protein
MTVAETAFGEREVVSILRRQINQEVIDHDPVRGGEPRIIRLAAEVSDSLRRLQWL